MTRQWWFWICEKLRLRNGQGPNLMKGVRGFDGFSKPREIERGQGHTHKFARLLRALTSVGSANFAIYSWW
jgi:hypothetical protein